MSDIGAYLVDFGIDSIVWFNSIWSWLNTPISSLADIDFGDGLLADLFETLFQSISTIVTSTIGDLSIVAFCFGAGFASWLIFSIVAFFKRFL